MYIDTSGVKYTNPIQGLDNLSDEIEVDLIIGTEATKYTNSKAIKIKENILEPYNYAILSNPQIKKVAYLLRFINMDGNCSNWFR